MSAEAPTPAASPALAAPVPEGDASVSEAPPCAARTCAARELGLELLDPGSVPLYRLFRHPGGDWDPTPAAYRHERADPPAGHKDAFAVLYLGDSLPAVAIECRILRVDFADNYTWLRSIASQYEVVRYEFSQPAVFLPLDGGNRHKLGLAGRQRALGSKGPFQEAALALYERFGRVVHGLSWESMHRDQAGRIYALWHEHKATIGLTRPGSRDYQRLVDDPEWHEFLTEHPAIEAIEDPSL